ncbi:MAG: dihydroorotate dehydrogenase [Parcubacteria group bacterium]|nr:dihydroorotate dehydrogenase [Parcubacteria group bacterium]
MNTQINFLGKKFENPLVVASGILGVTGSCMVRNIKEGAGGVTMKSVSLESREGNMNPTITTGSCFMLNAVGLSNAGVDKSIKEVEYYKDNCSAPIIASIFAGEVHEFGSLAKKITKAEPDFIEVNISCPHVKNVFGRAFAQDMKLAQQVTKIVKKNTKIKVIMKLSPNVENIAVIAKACEEAGADAICAVNTFNGTMIDIRTRKFVLTNRFGGVSGPAIKPMAVKAVYDIAQAVKIPIIGTGGVTTGEDAMEMMLAGATLVGVGSAVYFSNRKIFRKMMDDIGKIMKEEKIDKLEKIISGVIEDDKPVKNCCVIKKK